MPDINNKQVELSVEEKVTNKLWAALSKFDADNSGLVSTQEMEGDAFKSVLNKLKQGAASNIEGFAKNITDAILLVDTHRVRRAILEGKVDSNGVASKDDVQIPIGHQDVLDAMNEDMAFGKGVEGFKEALEKALIDQGNEVDYNNPEQMRGFEANIRGVEKIINKVRDLNNDGKITSGELYEVMGAPVMLPPPRVTPKKASDRSEMVV